MATAETKRISICLSIIFCLFILTIVILCLLLAKDRLYYDRGNAHVQHQAKPTNPFIPLLKPTEEIVTNPPHLNPNINIKNVSYGDGVCYSTDCKNVAKDMLRTIDHNVDPCEDFYKYSCGRLVDDPEIEEIDINSYSNQIIYDEITSGTGEESDDIQLGIFYKTCKKRQNYLPENDEFKEFLKNEVGNLINNNIDDWSITDVISGLMLNNYPILFDISIELDTALEVTIFDLKISLDSKPSILSQEISEKICQDLIKSEMKVKLKNETNYLDEIEIKMMRCKLYEDGMNARKKRFNYIIDEFNLLENVNDSSFKGKLIDKTVSFITRVQTMIYYNTNVIQNYRTLSVKELEKLSKDINWSVLFQKLNISIEDNRQIRVYNEKEIKELMTVHNSGIDTSNVLRLLFAEKIYSDIFDPQLHLSDNYCIDVAKALIPDLTSSIFIHSIDDIIWSKLNDDVDKIFKQIRSTILERYSSRDYPELSDALKNIKIQKGVGDEGKSTTLFEFNITLDKDYYHKNVFNLQKRIRQTMYGLFNQEYTNDLQLWMHFAQPYNTKGLHIHALNLIIIPQAMMFPPYLYKYSKSLKSTKSIPYYLNYAGIGKEISKLYLQVIDNIGLEKYEIPEIPNKLMDIGNNFNEKLFLQKFDIKVENDIVVDVDFSVLKSQFIDDLLTESAAVRIALLAYRKYIETRKNNNRGGAEKPLTWLEKDFQTPEQLYFLKLTQNHCKKNKMFDLFNLMTGHKLSPQILFQMVFEEDDEFKDAFKCKQMDPRGPYVWYE